MSASRSHHQETVSDANSPLDHLVAQVAARLEAGERVDLSSLTENCPEYREQLEMLLPTLEAVVDIENSLAATADDRSAPASDRQRLRTLGDFRIVREIGRGGMGVVYEATQISLNRRVALKVLPLAAVLDPRQLQRFKNEALAAGSLDHPNIVSVHTVARERGVHFFAMRLVDGQSLAELIDRLQQKKELPTKPISSDEEKRNDTQAIAALTTQRTRDSLRYFRGVAKLIIQAAAGLQHAHDAGLVHRDIKPSNLLVNDEGHLWITDFGLAQLPDSDNLTMTGDVLGTLRYMSPEQALGKHSIVDQRSDIYALGATLYELATLKPLMTGSGRQEILRQIANDDPIPPRKHEPGIPYDLETIILKATSKDAGDRYDTAAQLADDLSNFIDCEPIMARRPGPASHAARWIKRNLAVASSVVVTALVTLSVSLVFILWAYQSERAQRKISDQQRARAEDNLRLARATVDDMYTSVATHWIASDGPMSHLQISFLRKSLDFYRRLADKSPDTPHGRQSSSVAFTRIGQIHQHLDEHHDAIEALQQAIVLGEISLKRHPDIHENLTAMVWRYGSLGDSQIELAKYAAAEASYAKAWQCIKSLEQLGLTDKEIVARYQLGHAELLYHRDQLENAANEARKAVETFRELRSNNRTSLDAVTSLIKSEALLIDVLRHQQRFLEAQELNEKSLNFCNRHRRDLFHDSPQILRLEAILQRQAGDLAIELKHFDKAEEHYKKSLATNARCHKSGLDPISFFVGVFGKTSSLSEGLEPGSFCDYVETQLRFARLLQKVDRPYEAECVLGECTRTMQVLCDTRDDILRFRIARANSWALVSRLLYDRRPIESRIAEKWAATIWHDTLERFPESREYRSSLFGRVTDLSWFQNQMPDALNGQSDFTYGDEKQAVSNTPFVKHATGRSVFQEGNWRWSIGYFTKAAELRTEGHAYDWLHLSIACSHLGEHEKARRWYRRATESVEISNRTDHELSALSEQARELLNSARTN